MYVRLSFEIKYRSCVVGQASKYNICVYFRAKTTVWHYAFICHLQHVLAVIHFNVLNMEGGLHLGIVFHVCCCKIHLMMAKTAETCSTLQLNAMYSTRCTCSESKYRQWLANIAEWLSRKKNQNTSFISPLLTTSKDGILLGTFKLHNITKSEIGIT